MRFPENFAWGAAAAAHQIEGAAFEDGKGANVWDTFAHDLEVDPQTGNTNVMNLDNADVACDHYHRYKEDVALMKEMGLKAYRLSISWSRILPQGRGEINQKGIEFYSNLIDELLAAGIEPYVTLFHWDLPQAIQDIGGWANSEMPEIFAEYVKVVMEALSDRVTYWMTFNEPQCHILMGYVSGTGAPKMRVSDTQAFRLIHNLLKAHGRAVQTIRKYAKKKPMVGYAPNPIEYFPYTENEKDIEATRVQAFSAKSKTLWNATWWMDTIMLGHYPEDGIATYGERFPKDMIKEGDMELISQPLDFLGLNLYRGPAVRADKNGEPEVVAHKVGFDRTAFKWAVSPKIMHYMPKFMYERYHLPILITENGMSNCDWIALDGKVHDPQRIDFMHRYLLELGKAIEEGIPVIGYLTWSIMDNYEWNSGYEERFGLIHVDYETLKRTPKDSAYWYRDVIKTNGEIL